MRKQHIWISLLAVAVFVFLFSRDSLARLAWQKYHSPAASLTLAYRDTKLLMQLGNYYFCGGVYDLDKSERAYKKALRAEPGILWGHYQIARILFVNPVTASSNGVKGNYDGAIAEINKELETNPENLRSLYVRGLIYGYRNQTGDLERAADDFRRFTAWAPSEWAGYNDLAWILSKNGKYKEAKEATVRAFQNAEGAGENPWLWNSQGVAELNLGEYKNAIKSFEKAKMLAEKLALEDWRKSYPGNDPASANSGLNQFKEAIRKNLERAEALGAM